MTDSIRTKRGGRAFHSVLELHFDFIRQLRQRRKTWQEIAELLLAEKGIRVTLYAPYRFYRRQLRRAVPKVIGKRWKMIHNPPSSQTAPPE